jgi:hypothetical protein
VNLLVMWFQKFGCLVKMKSDIEIV